MHSLRTHAYLTKIELTNVHNKVNMVCTSLPAGSCQNLDRPPQPYLPCLRGQYTTKLHMEREMTPPIQSNKLLVLCTLSSAIKCLPPSAPAPAVANMTTLSQSLLSKLIKRLLIGRASPQVILKPENPRPLWKPHGYLVHVPFLHMLEGLIPLRGKLYCNV